MELPFEIVHVITASQLIDSESYERTLETMHIGRLRLGFYVVHWPSTAAELDTTRTRISSALSRRAIALNWRTRGQRMVGASSWGLTL
jgi:hypothetical protein